MKRLIVLTAIFSLGVMSLGAGGCVFGGDELGGTSWLLTGYTTRSDITPILDGIAVTLSFSEDASRITGNGGCNDYFGDCLVEGGSISISSVGATKKACSDPPGIMVQENAYFELLGKAERFSTDCCGLTIYCTGGELRFVNG